LEAVPVLATRRDADEWARQCVAEALGRIGAACSPGAVRRYLRRFRRTPARWLWRVLRYRDLPCEAVPDPQALAGSALRRLLSDPAGAAGAQAARRLTLLGGAAAAAAPDLVARLHETHEAVRVAAADALGRLGKADTQTLPALQGLLHDGSAALRAAAA